MVAHGLLDKSMTRQQLHGLLLDKDNAVGISAPESDTDSSTHYHLETDSRYQASEPSASSANRSQHTSRSAVPSLSPIDKQQIEPSSPIDIAMSVKTDVSPAFGAESFSSNRADDKMLRTVPDQTGMVCSAEAMEGHLNSLCSREYLPFCIFCKDSFLQDFGEGESQYCSPALVNALLALSTRSTDDLATSGRANGNIRDTQSSLPKPDSLAFFKMAYILVGGGTDANSLPDVQALGMLALYQLTRGYAIEAQRLADAFAGGATELCLQSSATRDKLGSQYKQVCATTFCGAISLAR